MRSLSSGQGLASVHHRHQIPLVTPCVSVQGLVCRQFLSLSPSPLAFGLLVVLNITECLSPHSWPFFSNISLLLVTQLGSLATGRGSSLLLVSLSLRQALPDGCGLLCPSVPPCRCVPRALDASLRVWLTSSSQCARDLPSFSTESL